MYCVYKHTSPSNKVYIGITGINPIRRWNNGWGYRNNKHFYNAILKYGWINFKHEIIYTNLTKEEACKKEIELINKYKSNNDKYGYNKSIGGEYGSLGCIRSEDTRRKIREAKKGNKRKISESGRYNISMAKRGYKNPNYGKRFSIETRHKMSVSSSKGIAQYTTDNVLIAIYISIKEAGEKTQIDSTNISRCASGKRKTAGGYLWRHVNDTKYNEAS